MKLMKYTIFILLMLMVTSAFAQSDFDKSVDSENGSIVFKGQLTLEDLKKESTFDWLNSPSNKYAPDSTDMKFLRKHLPNYKAVSFLGTWSHTLVPKLVKILDLVSFPASSHTIFGVDRSKKTKYVESQLYRIEFVPTIILYKGFTEIGRIVEAPEKSLEKDLVRIIQSHIDSGQ